MARETTTRGTPPHELRQTFGYDAWCGVCGKVATHVGGACVECCDVPARPVAPARQDPDRRRSA